MKVPTNVNFNRYDVPILVNIANPNERVFLAFLVVRVSEDAAQHPKKPSLNVLVEGHCGMVLNLKV